MRYSIWFQVRVSSWHSFSQVGRPHSNSFYMRIHPPMTIYFVEIIPPSTTCTLSSEATAAQPPSESTLFARTLKKYENTTIGARKETWFASKAFPSSWAPYIDRMKQRVDVAIGRVSWRERNKPLQLMPINILSVALTRVMIRHLRNLPLLLLLLCWKN